MFIKQWSLYTIYFFASSSWNLWRKNSLNRRTRVKTVIVKFVSCFDLLCSFYIKIKTTQFECCHVIWIKLRAVCCQSHGHFCSKINFFYRFEVTRICILNILYFSLGQIRIFGVAIQKILVRDAYTFMQFMYLWAFWLYPLV